MERHFGTELERKLNEARKKFDVITGTLNKNEKFWRICLICGNEEEEEFVGECSFCARVFANACNVGVDDSHINYYVCLPRDLHTYLQESGHGSRRLGSQSGFILYVELTSYGIIIHQNLGSHKEDAKFKIHISKSGYL